MIPIEKKRLEVGHISHRTDGDYKKVGEGEWVKVTEGNKPKEKKLIKRRNYESNTGDKEYDNASKESLSYLKDESLKRLRFYVGDSSEINDLLRGKNIYAKKDRLKRIKLAIKEIDQAFDEAPINSKQLSQLYRGGFINKKTLDSYSKNVKFKDASFISTSLNLDIAKGFLNKLVMKEDIVPVLFKIKKFKNDCKALPISSLGPVAYYSEKEFLLNRNTEFTVLDKKFNKEKNHWELTLSV